jgi:hypothetical protein
MVVLAWDETGEHLYETGVSKGVLYPQNNSGLYPLGIVWNGLTAVTENPSGAEATPIYADNIKYLNLLSAEEFGATVEAYTYPDEFAVCDGSAVLETGVLIGQQARTAFGLCYRTELGNDILGVAYGYKLHLIYGATAAPSEKGFQTINDSPEAITFSWEVSTIPVSVAGFSPTASLVVDSTKVAANTLAALEAILYGTAGSDPYLPLPDEVAALFAGGAPAAIALSTILPADGEPAAAIAANVVMTFNNEIKTEAVSVTDDNGVLVPGAKIWDVTGKILTFNPTDPLVNSTTYLVAINGVVDIYNQVLAPAIKDFTTVGA